MLLFPKQLCGEVHIIQEDVPLRTPRGVVVGKLAPLRNSQANSMSSTRHSCEEGNDSDVMSEGSYESERSATERRPHQYALVSSHSSEVYDESISSDDERSEEFYECQSERSPLYNYTRPVQLGLNKQKAGDNPGVEKRLFSYKQPNRVGWGKHSIARFHDVPSAFWPSWVYRMYDSYVLARKAAGKVVLSF